MGFGRPAGTENITGPLGQALDAAMASAQVNQIRGVTVANVLGSGIPKQVTNVSAGVSNATTGSTNVVKVTFRRNPGDVSFNKALVYLRGYNGNGENVLVASGADSPITFVLNNTGESVVVTVQSSGNAGDAPIASSPTTGLRLPKSTGGGFGNTTVTNTPAPTLVAGDNITLTVNGTSTTIAAATSFRTAGQEWITSWDSMRGYGTGGGNGGSWIPGGAAANTVYFVQLNIRETVTIRKVTAFWSSNSAGGPHFSGCAIYSLDGTTKLVDAGTNAFSDANITTPQTVTLGSPVTLTPGPYLVAWSATTNAGSGNMAFSWSSNQEVAMLNNTYKRYGTAGNAMSGGAMPSSLGTLTVRNVADNFAGFIFES